MSPPQAESPFSDPDHPQATGLAATVLGRLSVGGVEGAALGDLDSRFHVKALFALLAATPGALEREELLQALWPQQPAAAARNRLHHTVHLLRQSLAALAARDDWVHSGGGQVALHEALHSDARCVAQAARSAEAQALADDRLHEALRHCGAAWMPDLELGEAGERCRRRVEHDQALLLREGARRLAVAGDTAMRRSLLARLRALQPTDEWACRELMALDLAAGRPNAALAHFEALTRVLAERLGLRASVATAALAAEAGARLARPADGDGGGEHGPAADGAAAVPGSGLLLGRERESEILRRACAEGGARVNLCGVAGVGKTALAAEVARALGARFEAVVWLGLGELEAGRTASAALAQALKVQDLGATSTWSRRVLLVLDDLDLAPGVAALLETIDAAARRGPFVPSVLCISHAPLWPADRGLVLRLEGLALPPVDEDAATAARHAAVALYLMRCPAGPADEPRPADIAALVRRLDGLPLAIELAAARSASMTAGELLARIDESLSVLALPSPAPSVSMDMALARSVRALPAAARALLPRLAVFGTPFTADDVAAVTGAAPIELEPALLACCEHGLLERVAGHAWLRLPHLVRLHARAHAVAAGTWPQARQAWLGELHARVAALDLDWASPGHEDALLALAAQQDALLDMLSQAGESDPVRAVRIVCALGVLWSLRGDASRLVAWLPRALAWADAQSLAPEALCLHRLAAAVLPTQFEHVQALVHAQAAEALARRLGDVDGIVHAVCLAADVHCWLGRADEARALRASIEREFGLAAARAGGPHETAFWRWRLHPLSDELQASGALPPLPTGEALAELRQRHAGSALWLALLMEVCREGVVGGQPAAALAAADEAGQRARRLGAAALEARALWERLWCELALDRLDDCATSAQRLRQLWQGAEDGRRPLTAALLSAELGWRRGQLHAATTALADGQALAARIENNPFAHDLMLHGAIVAALGGDVEAAWPAWRAVASVATGLSPQHLFLASEAAVVLHGVAGQAAAVGLLGAVLRQLDGFNEATPLVQRFRDQWFVGQAPAAVPGHAADALTLLRSLLQAAARSSPGGMGGVPPGCAPDPAAGPP